MKTSATQLETLDLCGRKWWLQRKAKMPEAKKDHFGFGTVLHGCAERSLKGEELFPTNWDIDPDTGVRIDPKDAALIIVLIEKAISMGYLEARHDSRVEEEFELPITDTVTAIGFKDHAAFARVEDHKTSKTVRYFKGAEGLKNSIQMMLYIKDELEKIRKTGQVPPGIFTLVHNQFLRDYEFPEVRRREAEVTPNQIDKYWKDVIVPLAKKQEELNDVKDPFSIPDPPKSACSAFGGCPYMTICSGAEDLLTYKRRIDSINKKDARPAMTVKPVSPSDFLAARGKSAPPAEPAAAINPPAPKVAVVQPPLAVIDAPPPWAAPTCPMCSKKKSPGFSAETGKPCRICLSMTKVPIGDIEWSSNGDATIVWWDKGKRVAETETPPPVEDAGEKTVYSLDDLYKQLTKCTDADAVSSLIVEADTVASDDELDLFMKAADKKLVELETPPEAAPPAEEPKRPRGRPRKNPAPVQIAPVQIAPVQIGLVLMVGCTAMKPWPGKTVLFAEEFLSKIEGYWANDAVFDRRAKLRNSIETADENFFIELRDTIIVQGGRDPDVDNLISSLTPYAFVIRGTIG